MNISLAYVLLIAPIFFYIGIAREQVPDIAFSALGLFGVGNFLLNAYWAYTKISGGNSPWLNYINLFIISPLVIILVINGKTANRKYFEMLLMVAFAAFGYHLLSIIREIISR
jgi:hypothetical protein